MSSEEQIKARGQLLTDYITAKQDLADIESRAKRYGPILESIGRSLSNPNQINVVPDSEGLLTDKVMTLIREMDDTRKRKAELAHQLQSLGIAID